MRDFDSYKERPVRNGYSWRSLWTSLALPVSFLTLVSCNDSSGGTGNVLGPDVQLTVRLENREPAVLGEAVHLFRKGAETFPCCQVQPQLERNTPAFTARQNGTYEFEAGRNGQVLDTKGCKCTSACPAQTGGTVGTPTVRWNGTALSCIGW